MPFHRFYCSPNLYTREEKQAIAQTITKYYAKLPPFLVLVSFIDVDKDSFYVGGEPNDRYLRINVQHSADPVQGYVVSRPWIEGYEKALEPFTKGKGIGWELQMTNDDVSFLPVQQKNPHSHFHCSLTSTLTPPHF
ncbi:putative oxalocrotonate tautomerase [Lentinula novae-zelandiae]|uniref:Oxalocrotonate tautomerase n=1 Tax=Lentinula aff. lateritia TaxID=2804960 RepID=A0ACC1U3L4_9AGAR|nr:putative oxalocrotonate tautomerase [Lentinula aff. lateritia]KAJ3856432.1 putative oxalocrotonate tautomerase [Lentinula lateritia]KAJ3861343.1 putative oxalocrotonate tautomerase [Lentinula novae-zelandiae]KAJ3891771.1 putative oxalocrotonate tautomerase [Lentinula edodes]